MPNKDITLNTDPQQKVVPAANAPQFDWNTASRTSDLGNQTMLADDVKSLWRNVFDTSALEPIRQYVESGEQQNRTDIQQTIQDELNHGNPVRAAIAKYLYGGSENALEAVDKVIFGATTPSNVALSIATGGESAASQALKAGTSLYFGYRGSQALITGRQQGESASDEIQRRALGALQLVTSGEGAVTGAVAAKEAFRSYVQNSLGIGGDLAARVQAKVEQAQEEQTASATKQGVIEKAVGGATNKISDSIDSKIAAIQANAKSQIDALQSPTEAQIEKINTSAKSQIDAVKSVGEDVTAQASAQIPLSLNQIKAEATKVIAQKQGDFESQYASLNKEATAPVTTVNDLKTEILNSLKDRGVQDGEISKIENKIFAALPKEPTTSVRAPTASENTSSMLATSLSKSGMNADSIRAALVNQGYVPTQIDTAMTMAFPHLQPADTMNVSYEMSRRVKTDLWEAQQSATDSTMKLALGDALDNVQGIRQRYATAQGFGDRARRLDTNYMQFKRDLGSGTMSDFTSANNFAEENSILKQAQYLDSNSGEALRGLFDLAGVDTKPLRDALKNKDAFTDLEKLALPDVQKYAASETKRINSEYQQSVDAIQGQSDASIKQLGSDRKTILTALQNKRDMAIANLGKQMRDNVTQIGENNPIIPGTSDLDLQGKTGLQIRQEAMRATLNNAKKAGITNPFALTQILYGVAQLGFGSAFGLLHIGRGIAPSGIQRLLGSESFQSFAAQEAGVTPEAMPQFREAISKSAPYLKKMAISTAISSSINTANQPKKQNSPAIDISKPIAIAGTQ